MSFLKVKHLFTGLMAMSAATAFAIPPRYVQSRVPAIDGLFAPVSRPCGAIARWAHNSFAAPDLSVDRRSAEDVKRENDRLKNELSNVTTRLIALEKRESGRNQIGPIRDYCTPFPVASTDSGAHASLGIQGSSLQGIQEGMIALYPRGIVGRVMRTGLIGARVQLVTDVGFRERIGFVRFDGARFVRLKPEQSFAEGTGNGAMRIDGLTRELVKNTGLQVGDWVTLNEPEWPAYLQGFGLGQIVSIAPLRTAPLFTHIVVEPPQNLLRLTEVLIVTREPGRKGGGDSKSE